MYAWTMLTEFNCQSATHVKNAVLFYYSHPILCMHAMSACSTILSIFVTKCMLNFSIWTTWIVSPANFPKRSFGQKKPVHCSFQGKWFSVGFIMMNEAQDVVFCFICFCRVCLLHCKRKFWMSKFLWDT